MDLSTMKCLLHAVWATNGAQQNAIKAWARMVVMLDRCAGGGGMGMSMGGSAHLQDESVV